MVTPTTLDEAVDALLADMDSLDRETFLTDGYDHHGIGRHLRNELGLWHNETPLAQWFKTNGIHHGDDRSACLFVALRARLTKQPFDIAAEAAYYQRFWAESEKRHAEGGTHTFHVDKDGRVEFTDEPKIPGDNIAFQFDKDYKATRIR